MAGPEGDQPHHVPDDLPGNVDAAGQLHKKRGGRELPAIARQRIAGQGAQKEIDFRPGQGIACDDIERVALGPAIYFNTARHGLMLARCVCNWRRRMLSSAADGGL